MEKIQEILFENKEKIPDGVYLELMNTLKIEKKDFYKIEYEVIRPHLFFNKEEENIIIHTSVEKDNNHENKKYEIIISSHNPNLYDSDKKKLNEGLPFVWDGRNIIFNDKEKDIITIRHSTEIQKNKDNNEEYSDDDNFDENDEYDSRKIHINTHLRVRSIYFITSITKC